MAVGILSVMLFPPVALPVLGYYGVRKVFRKALGLFGQRSRQSGAVVEATTPRLPAIATERVKPDEYSRK